jgi:hypothetical protein
MDFTRSGKGHDCGVATNGLHRMQWERERERERKRERERDSMYP